MRLGRARATPSSPHNPISFNPLCLCVIVDLTGRPQCRVGDGMEPDRPFGVGPGAQNFLHSHQMAVCARLMTSDPYGRMCEPIGWPLSGAGQGLGSSRPKKRTDGIDDLRLQHIEPAVVLLIEDFTGLRVEGQPPKTDRVHLAFDLQVDAGAED
jgi:hypothetical protein